MGGLLGGVYGRVVRGEFLFLFWGASVLLHRFSIWPARHDKGGVGGLDPISSPANQFPQSPLLHTLSSLRRRAGVKVEFLTAIFPGVLRIRSRGLDEWSGVGGRGV